MKPTISNPNNPSLFLSALLLTRTFIGALRKSNRLQIISIAQNTFSLAHLQIRHLQRHIANPPPVQALPRQLQSAGMRADEGEGDREQPVQRAKGELRAQRGPSVHRRLSAAEEQYKVEKIKRELGR